MWIKFAGEFFTADACLSISLPDEVAGANGQATGQPERVYQISRALIPRFFHTWAESGGLTSLLFAVERIKETFLPNNLLLFDSHRIRMLSGLQTGQQMVEHTGSMRILFYSTSKIQFMELCLTGHEHFLNSKSDNLFTLPLQGGFDPAVHHFLEMLLLMQTSFAGQPSVGALSIPLEQQFTHSQQHMVDLSQLLPTPSPAQILNVPPAMMMHHPRPLANIRPKPPQDMPHVGTPPPQSGDAKGKAPAQQQLKFEVYNPDPANF